MIGNSYRNFVGTIYSVTSQKVCSWSIWFIFVL